MAEDKIQEWIQQKLEKGIEKERIKESLKNTGHDPELVEEVQHSQSVGDDPFSQEEDQNLEETSISEKDEEVREMDLEFDSASEEESEQEDSSFSIPSVRNTLDRKILGIVGLALLISVGMAGFFTYIDVSDTFAPQCSGESKDDGTGVKIYSVSADKGITTAEVNAYEEVSVILEVFDSGEKIGQTIEQYDSPGNRKEISVDAVGDRVSFHEYGCESPSIDRNY